VLVHLVAARVADASVVLDRVVAEHQGSRGAFMRMEKNAAGGRTTERRSEPRDVTTMPPWMQI